MHISLRLMMKEFRPNRVLILTKLTRYEFEKRLHPDLNEDQLGKVLTARGSDFERLRAKHNTHQQYLQSIVDQLMQRGMQVRVVQRWEFTSDQINWAELLMSAGGDGTFLLAASRLRDKDKPLIGINTDPISSEGHLCIVKKLPLTELSSVLDRLFFGSFNWLWRQRIRVRLSGWAAASDPIELHDQQLMFPECRWAEHVREGEEARKRAPRGNQSKLETLPYLALNDVFIGESVSSRVSYYELKINDGPWVKQKSSGVTVSTGTGSTSWYFNINKLTEQCMMNLLPLIKQELAVDIPSESDELSQLAKNVVKRFNERLIFSPEDPRMAFAVRDSVFNQTYPTSPPWGFANKMMVKSRCFDAHLVIDGGLSFVFNDGAQASLEIHPDDALRTVVFR